MKSREEELVLEIYRELFAASTPPADFDELVKNATINKQGQREIPFMDHEIDEGEFHKILNDKLNKSRISKYKKQMVRNTIFLGCSPKFKQDAQN